MRKSGKMKTDNLQHCLHQLSSVRNMTKLIHYHTTLILVYIERQENRI